MSPLSSFPHKHTLAPPSTMQGPSTTWIEDFFKKVQKADLVLEAEGDVEEDSSYEAEGDVNGGVLESVDPLEVGRLVDRYIPGRRKLILSSFDHHPDFLTY